MLLIGPHVARAFSKAIMCIRGWRGVQEVLHHLTGPKASQGLSQGRNQGFRPSTDCSPTPVITSHCLTVGPQEPAWRQERPGTLHRHLDSWAHVARVVWSWSVSRHQGQVGTGIGYLGLVGEGRERGERRESQGLGRIPVWCTLPPGLIAEEMLRCHHRH